MLAPWTLLSGCIPSVSCHVPLFYYHMMTCWHKSVFRKAGTLWWESPGHGFPSQSTSNAEFDVFFVVVPNKLLNKQRSYRLLWSFDVALTNEALLSKYQVSRYSPVLFWANRVNIMVVDVPFPGIAKPPGPRRNIKTIFPKYRDSMSNDLRSSKRID